MSILSQPIDGLEAFHIAKDAVRYRELPLNISGAIDSQKCHLIHNVSQDKHKVIITYNDVRCREIVEDMQFFAGERVFHYPSKDIIFYSADVHSYDIIEARMRVIREIDSDKSLVVVMSIDTLFEQLIPYKLMMSHILELSTGSEIKLQTLSRQLALLGYTRSEQVESRGQFAVRGGIIDVFPLTEEHPFRIELWGDEIDSIKGMNQETQRSTFDVPRIKILPAREVVVEEHRILEAKMKLLKDREITRKSFEKAKAFEALEHLERYTNQLLERIENECNFNGIEGLISYYFDNLVSFMDYFDEPLIILDEPQRLSERMKNARQEFEESMKNRYEKGYLLKGQLSIFRDEHEVIRILEKERVIMLSTLQHKDIFFSSRHKVELNVRSIQPYHNSFDHLVKDLKYWLSHEYKVVLLSASKTRAARVVAMLEDADVHAHIKMDLTTEIVTKSVAVSIGSLHKGFEYPQAKFVVLTETELVGKKRKLSSRRKEKGKGISGFDELKIGDYVVHENHGVGVFKGIEKIEVEGISKDFIKIGYKDNGNLYIATSQLDMLQKYISGEGKSPKLNKLGTQEWKKAKARVKGAVEEIAGELIALYAKREQARGFQFGQDTLWQTEFEEVFPYQETDDQLNAIEDTKRDMESNKIMDRLICGDVGYGKTEVAIRAGFKAVQDNKQVAYLVPTTILAQQQYSNFVQRMKDFPIKIEVLSRFKTPKEQKLIIEQVNRGQVDIIIGTHRLLSKDIIYKDLGLLIIDEEQRFGVKHKETIKGIKDNVDVLTLTATPIPRTLHMSLIGIRDMSLLEEPPEERHPIQTYVLEQNDEVIKDAIYRELGREGQVYYVYNRVKDIDEIAAKIGLLVPEANVAFAHGQMSERELENIMFDYINGDIDVLVATTIIETGLDIANSNTMIIQDADHMGLSQLYQLRGRVGRSNRVAYAYLMYRRDKVLQEVAEKRLKAIKEFTEFGAGFKIAMRDLEIRGAGNILGASQSGHMDAVGYDLYCKMLTQEIKKQSHEPVEESFETSIDMMVDAYISSEYISNEVRKIESYKRIAAIKNESDYQDVIDELLDRYGDMPKAVENLIEIALVKALAHEVGIVSVEQKRNQVIFLLKSDAPLEAIKIPQLILDYDKRLKFTVSERPYFVYELKEDKEIFRNIKNLLQDIKALKVEGA